MIEKVTPLYAGRSPQDQLSGVLRLRVGGEEREIPTLKLRQSRKWKEQAAKALGNIDVPWPPPEDEPLRWVASLASVPSDIMFDLVVAYDVGNALSGKALTGPANRKWLEENLDDRELYAATRQMVTASFPFVVDLQTLVEQLRPFLDRFLKDTELRRLTSALSKLGSSTSGPSPTGDSTPTDSKDGSPTSS